MKEKLTGKKTPNRTELKTKDIAVFRKPKLIVYIIRPKKPHRDQNEQKRAQLIKMRYGYNSKT